MLETEDETIVDASRIAQILNVSNISLSACYSMPKHILSHQHIFATFYVLRGDLTNVSVFLKIKPSELHTFAIPRLIDRYLEKHPI